AKLAQHYPSPRKRELVPLWMYLSSQLSLRLHGQHGFHGYPLIIRAGGLVDAGPARTLGSLGSIGIAPGALHSYTILRVISLAIAHGGQTMTKIQSIGMDEVVGYFSELEDP